MSLIERALVTLVLAALHIAAGYWWGSSNAAGRYEAAQSKANAATAARVRAAEAKGDSAVASYIADHFEQEERYAQIAARNTDLARTAGLLSRGHDGADCRGAGDGGPADPAAAGPAVELAARPVGGAAPGSQPAAQGPGAELSLRAVWLWNSGLAGRDVPAGACGLATPAGQARAACAAGSGIGLEDAWSNHTLNAASCAADRARYAALSQLLRKRGLVADGGTP